MAHSSLSRRDFLKLGAAGLSAWFLSPILKSLAQETSFQGRILESPVHIHAFPDLESEITGVFWKDDVVTFTGATIGGIEPSYNRIWYHIPGKGYLHSGIVQPVETRLNLPVENIPPGGTLAEVTVPYTDAYWGPGRTARFAYRYYYETTYWVSKLVTADDGEAWYKVMEDKWDLIFYVPAKDLRIVPPEELAQISPNVPAEAKRLEVDIGNQVLIAYEYNRPVYVARAATGAKFYNGEFYTPGGRHLTFHKRPSRHMAAGNPAAGGYDLPGVPWVTYFTESGVSIHGTYWHNDFGKPRSHGCVNLTARDARWVYLWSNPFVPTSEQMLYGRTGTVLDIY